MQLSLVLHAQTTNTFLVVLKIQSGNETMYYTGSREIAKLSIEAVGEIDEYVSSEYV